MNSDQPRQQTYGEWLAAGFAYFEAAPEDLASRCGVHAATIRSVFSMKEPPTKALRMKIDMAFAFYANEKEMRDQGLEVPRTETMVREYRSTGQFSSDVAQLSPFGWTVVTSNELRENG